MSTVSSSWPPQVPMAARTRTTRCGLRSRHTRMRRVTSSRGFSGTEGSSSGTCDFLGTGRRNRRRLRRGCVDRRRGGGRRRPSGWQVGNRKQAGLERGLRAIPPAPGGQHGRPREHGQPDNPGAAWHTSPGRQATVASRRGRGKPAPPPASPTAGVRSCWYGSVSGRKAGFTVATPTRQHRPGGKAASLLPRPWPGLRSPARPGAPAAA